MIENQETAIGSDYIHNAFPAVNSETIDRLTSGSVVIFAMRIQRDTPGSSLTAQG